MTPTTSNGSKRPASKGRQIFMVQDCGICRESYQTALLAVGGVMLAVEAVMDGPGG